MAGDSGSSSSDSYTPRSGDTYTDNGRTTTVDRYSGGYGTTVHERWEVDNSSGESEKTISSGF